jgi:hypothetical protein
MGKATLICVFLVFALLLEDGSSVRKRTEEEEKEDREIAEKVNATLAEEEEKERQEEREKKRRQDQEKKRQDQEKEPEETGQETSSGTGKKEGQDEACPTFNLTCPDNKPCPICPEVRPCFPCKKCPAPVVCQPCEDCPPCKKCGPCPIRPIKPCQPCVSNDTIIQPPSNPGCSESIQAMTVPVAMAVGAGAALLVTCVATVIGLVIRYVPPTVSGFLCVATIIIVWYLSSQYPETARELGRRAWTTLQEATVALGHRIVEAIRHHNEQVSLLTSPNLFLSLSSSFHLKSLH